MLNMSSLESNPLLPVHVKTNRLAAYNLVLANCSHSTLFSEILFQNFVSVRGTTITEGMRALESQNAGDQKQIRSS